MARSFPGSGNNYLFNAVTPVTAQPFTTLIRFRANALADKNLVVIGNTGGNEYWALRTTAAGNLRIELSGVSGLADSTNSYGTSVWHTAAHREESTAMRRIILDGNAGSMGSLSSAFTPAVSLLHVGGYHVSGSTFGGFNGDLAELAVFSVALTDAEIAAFHKGWSPLLIRPAALEMYVPIYGRSATTEPGRWGGNALDLAGTLAQAAHPPGLIHPVGPYVFDPGDVTLPPAGRTTKNTRARPLGLGQGLSRGYRAS